MSRIYIEKKLLKECLIEAFEKGWAGYKDLKEEVVDNLIQTLEQQDYVQCRSVADIPTRNIVIDRGTESNTEINWQTMTISNAVSSYVESVGSLGDNAVSTYIESSGDNSIFLPSTFSNANA